MKPYLRLSPACGSPAHDFLSGRTLNAHHQGPILKKAVIDLGAITACFTHRNTAERFQVLQFGSRPLWAIAAIESGGTRR